MPKYLRDIVISECSSVDRGADPLAKVMIMKRDGGEMQTVPIAKVADALSLIIARKSPAVAYSAMMKVAKMVSPGNEGDDVAFSRAYTGSNARVSNTLLSQHIAKSLGAANNPQRYDDGHEDLPHDGDEDDEDSLDREDASSIRPTS
jgi:hypothetical protein